MQLFFRSCQISEPSLVDLGALQSLPYLIFKKRQKAPSLSACHDRSVEHQSIASGPVNISLPNQKGPVPLDHQPLESPTPSVYFQMRFLSYALQLGVGPPLPPTFEIEIFKAHPLSSPLCCDKSVEAVNDTSGCIGYQGSVLNDNGSLLLIS